MDREARGGALILGGGFAGSYVARRLKKRGATIVSPENFMLFASMLPEAASGTLEPRHVVVPLRQMCPHADLVLGRAISHDGERRRVQVETEEGLVNVHYRDLVVALGAIPRVLPIPGLGEHALLLTIGGIFIVVVIGFLILSGAVNTAIIGSNGVLNRVAEDGVLPEWFLRPHPR